MSRKGGRRARMSGVGKVVRLRPRRWACTSVAWSGAVYGSTTAGTVFGVKGQAR